ncbi:MAG: hypothetical protein IBX68_08010 [Dehalococcoidia bacterium]|nr:hypothetical protein [Dehalococcoidia bacterium]
MEQRINALEEELKVLKSQIKAVLLDIKEYLASGDGSPGLAPAMDNVALSQAGPEKSPGAGSELHGTDSGTDFADKPLKGSSVSDLAGYADFEHGDRKALDLLTVSVLAQWLSRAMREIGRDQIGKLIEIYDITGNLSRRLKDTLLLLVELCSDDGQAVCENTSISASAGIQLLIELDSLLRYRKNALESVVLSMLAEGRPADGKGKNG